MSGKRRHGADGEIWGSAVRYGALGVMVLGGLILTACQAPPRNFLNENDRLRRENYRLLQRVGQLQEALEERIREIEALEKRLAGPGAAVEGVGPADIPAATSLRLGRYSGLIDTDGDGQVDAVRLYVEPLDQRGRFIPVAGRLVVQVVRIQPGQDAQVLAEKSWAGVELDRVYRTGFTGTHYTVELALPKDVLPELKDVTVKATLTDAGTGLVLTAQEGFMVRRR